MSNNLLIVPSDTDKTLVMVPVQAVKQDLVTKTDYLIYVPLASKEAHGTVKIGDGISVINGVISIDPNGDVLNTKVDKYQGKDKYKQALIVDSEGYVTTGYAPGSIDIYKNVSLVREDSGYLRFSDDFRILNEDNGVNVALINPIPVKTSDITNDGDGKSPYATQDFVAVNGGKIDTIYVNNEVSPILNKAVYLQIPTKLSDLGIDKDIAYVEDVSKAVSEHNLDKNAHTDIQTKLLEVEAIAKGRSKIVTYNDYTSMIRAFNVLPINEYAVGQSVFIKTLKVPDLWISSVDETSELYAYTSDDVIVSALKEQGYIKVGYYNLSPLETEKVDLTNYVTLNGIQKISGIKTFTSMIGLLNSEEGEADFIKHINNNLLITSHDGKSLLNIDEQLEKIYSFNKELANKEFIKDNYLSFTESQTLTSDQQALIRSKIGAAGGEHNLDYTKLINLPTLKTNNSGSLNPSEEELNGVINLHKVSKTGLLADLIDSADYRTVSDTEKTAWNNKFTKFIGSNNVIPRLNSTTGELQTSLVTVTDEGNLNAKKYYIDNVSFSAITKTGEKYISIGASDYLARMASREQPVWVKNGVKQGTFAMTSDIPSLEGYATEDYVNTNGGKIDKIKVNGTEQSITNKEVDLAIPTKVTDLIDGTDYVKNTDYATGSVGGVIKPSTSLGTYVNSSGVLRLVPATEDEISGKTQEYKPITPKTLDYAVKSGLVNNKLTWTDDEKTNARLLIDAASSNDSANKLALSIDNSTYIMTLSLLNKDDTVLDTKTIDLPLESVVVDGRLDEDTDEIVLVLKNGNEIRFSITDVIEGLATKTEVNAVVNRVTAVENRATAVENKNVEQEAYITELDNKKADLIDVAEDKGLLLKFVTGSELRYSLGVTDDIHGVDALALMKDVTIDKTINIVVDESDVPYPLTLIPYANYRIKDRYGEFISTMGGGGASYDKNTGACILTWTGVIAIDTFVANLVFIDRAEKYYGPIEYNGVVYDRYSAFICRKMDTGEDAPPSYSGLPVQITSMVPFVNKYGTIRDINNLNNYTKTSDLAKVALSNNFDDLDNKPIIPEGAVIYHNFGPNIDGSISQKVMTEKFEEMEAEIAGVAPKDGKLSFTKNGKEVNSFSANQETSVEVSIDGIPIVKHGDYSDSNYYDKTYDTITNIKNWSTYNYPGITEYYEGLTILYKVPSPPGLNTTNLNINSLGYAEVVTGNLEPLSSETQVGTFLILTYCKDVKIKLPNQSTPITKNIWLATDYGNNDYNKTHYVATSSDNLANYVGLCTVYPTVTDGTYSMGYGYFNTTYPILGITTRPGAGETTKKAVLYGVVNYVTSVEEGPMVQNLPVYLKGKLTGVNFRTTSMTQIVPTTEDGFQYLLLGTGSSGTETSSALCLFASHPIYEYKDGAFRLYNHIPSEYVTETELTAKDYASNSSVDSKDTTTLNSAKSYTDAQVAALVNGAPDKLNTLDELAAALKDNENIVDTLNEAIGNKLDKTGGTISGSLTVTGDVIGNYVAAKTAGHETGTYDKIATLSSTGYVRYRTKDELKSDLGVPTGAAASKGVVTTIDTSANLPTSNAVKTFVEGKGYITSSGSITGNAATATKATQDGSGNVITDTYAKKTELSTIDSSLSSTSVNPVQNKVVNAALSNKLATADAKRLYCSMVPYGTSIPGSIDLNTTTYIKVGNYYCSKNADVKTLTNCPTQAAFMMQVYSPLGTNIDNEATSAWVYRVRKLFTYEGDEFVQSVYSGSTAGTFTYGGWKKITRNTDIDSSLSTTSTNAVQNKVITNKLATKVNFTETSEATETANRLLDLIYPVGSIYLTISGNDYSNFLGGKWVRVAQGRALFGAGSITANGSTLTYTADSYVAAGLPNITGSITNASGAWGNAGSGSGVFSVGSKTGEIGSSGSAISKYTVNFNASSGATTSGIYGNSSTVQPNAYVVYMWRRDE